MRAGMIVLLLLGCGRTEVYPRRLPDGSVLLLDRDAGAPDAGTSDAGPPDAGCDPGCADGTREAFRDACHYVLIAACEGAFTVPGVLDAGPRCGRQAGNNGADPSGQGCSVEDLCADGWHLCRDVPDVTRASSDGCAGAAFLPAFFVTAQTGPGCGNCATGTRTGCGGNTCEADCAPNAETTNDAFGCGGAGGTPQPSCGVLNRFTNNLCTALSSPWSCGASGVREAVALLKGEGPGGALCCRD